MKIEIDENGKLISSFPLNEWLDFSNSFVYERAYLSQQAFIGLEKEYDYLRKLVKKISEHKAIASIAYEDKKIIGLCVIKQKSFPFDNYATLGIAVRKEYRKKGIGKKLIIKAIERAFNIMPIKYIELLVVEENKPAISLYKSVGFSTLCKREDYFNHYGVYKNAILMILSRNNFHTMFSSLSKEKEAFLKQS